MERKVGIIIVVFLMLASEFAVPSEGKIMCKVRSRAWTGLCRVDTNCAQVCLSEGNTDGHCKWFKCYCLRPCGGGPSPKPPPPDDDDPPETPPQFPPGPPQSPQVPPGPPQSPPVPPGPPQCPPCPPCPPQSLSYDPKVPPPPVVHPHPTFKQ